MPSFRLNILISTLVFCRCLLTVTHPVRTHAEKAIRVLAAGFTVMPWTMQLWCMCVEFLVPNWLQLDQFSVIPRRYMTWRKRERCLCIVFVSEIFEVKYSDVIPKIPIPSPLLGPERIESYVDRLSKFRMYTCIYTVTLKVLRYCSSTMATVQSDVRSDVSGSTEILLNHIFYKIW